MHDSPEQAEAAEIYFLTYGDYPTDEQLEEFMRLIESNKE